MRGTLLLLSVLVVTFVSCLPAFAEERSDTGGGGGAGDHGGGTALLMGVLASADDAGLQLDVLRGIHAAFEGRRQVAPPKGWDAVYAKLGKSEHAELRSLTRALAAVFGDRRAIADMRAVLQDAAADAT